MALPLNGWQKPGSALVVLAGQKVREMRGYRRVIRRLMYAAWPLKLRTRAFATSCSCKAPVFLPTERVI
jgi:hypothetical protein